MQTYRISPDDVLFFRDARPMIAGEGSGGHGGRWPEPAAIFDALHRAFHETFPRPQPWEHRREGGGKGSTQRFGSLRTAGLFPCQGGEWFFPAPADVTLARGGESAGTLALLPAGAFGGKTSLPSPLTHVAAATTPPSKDALPTWWSRAAWEAYLADRHLPSCEACERKRRSEDGAGTVPAPEPAKHTCGLHPLSEFATAEWHTGIGLDDESGTQDGVSIYSAEYLRLRPGVELGFAAAMQDQDLTDADAALAELLRAAPALSVGGQQRVSRVEPMGAAPGVSVGRLLPRGLPMQNGRVKWVLLTPAIFPAQDKHPGGWLPPWINAPTGAVLLATGRPGMQRTYIVRDGKRRAVRAGASVPISARLVAARIPKPVVLNGFSRRAHLRNPTEGPRETLLAVPAGAVFYFEAEGRDEQERRTNAQALADALSWHGALSGDAAAPIRAIRNRRSALWGEKGYGLGVCGTWKDFPKPGKPDSQSR